jgi:hypothetical protein
LFKVPPYFTYGILAIVNSDGSFTTLYLNQWNDKHISLPLKHHVMDTKLAAFIDSLPSQTLYVLARWPFFEHLKKHSWFDHECVYYGTWDTESIIKAYFVPLGRMLELYAQGDPETILFTKIGRA